MVVERGIRGFQGVADTGRVVRLAQREQNGYDTDADQGHNSHRTRGGERRLASRPTAQALEGARGARFDRLAA